MEGSGYGLLWDEIQEFALNNWGKPTKTGGWDSRYSKPTEYKQKFYCLGYDDRFSAVEIKAVWMQNSYLYFKLELLELFQHVYVTFRGH